MITKSREAFKNIYGNNANEFKHKLYEIYEKDKLKSNSRKSGCSIKLQY